MDGDLDYPTCLSCLAGDHGHCVDGLVYNGTTARCGCDVTDHKVARARVHAAWAAGQAIEDLD